MDSMTLRRKILANTPHIDTATGSIATFSTDLSAPMKECKAEFAPVQDLHGYDNPWPAGGGKNLFNPSLITYSVITVNSDETLIVNGTDNRAWTSVDEIPLNAGTYYVTIFENTGYAQLRTSDSGYSTNVAINNRTQTQITLSQDGGIKMKLALSSDSSVYPVSVKILITTDSTVTIWSPYSNYCPITGWTGVNVSRTGVNIWDEEWEVGSIKNVDGTKTASNDRIRSKNYIPCEPLTTYYLAIKDTRQENTWCNIFFYDANKTFLSMKGVYFKSTGNLSEYNNPFTTVSGTKYMLFVVQNTYGTTYNNDISINYPSSDTSYHAYTGTTIPVSFESASINVWDEQWENGTFNTTTGANINNSQIRAKNKIPVSPSTEYYVATPSYLWFIFYDSSENVITSGLPSGNVGSSGNSRGIGGLYAQKFTTPSNCHYIRFYAQNVYGSTYNHDISINYPSTDHSYHPYGVQYGGYWDVVSGTLTAKMASFNLGSVGYFTYQSSSDSFLLYGSQIVPNRANGGNMLCSNYPVNSTASASAQAIHDSADKQIYWQTSNSYIYIKDSTYGTDASAFKTAMNGVQLVYELATPLTYQLTPQQIKTLSTNNVWSDAGNVEVEYWAH